MSEKDIFSIDTLITDIADHSYEKHVVQRNEFSNKVENGQALTITTQEEFRQHIQETLESEQTRCFKVSDGVEKGTMYFYNDQSNTMIVIPGRKDLKPTAYRPEAGAQKFEDKVEKTSKQQGYEPEISHGIYELIPELKKELVLIKDLSEAEKAKREQEETEKLRREALKRMLAEALEKTRSHDFGGRER